MLSIKPYFFETEEDLSCLPSEDQTLLDDISEPPDEFRVKHFEWFVEVRELDCLWYEEVDALNIKSDREKILIISRNL